MTTLAEQVSALNLPPMTDGELSTYLGLDGTKEGPRILAGVTPEERATYDNMRAVETLIPRWQSGIDPYPSDVSVNRERGRKRKP